MATRSPPLRRSGQSWWAVVAVVGVGRWGCCGRFGRGLVVVCCGLLWFVGCVGCVIGSWWLVALALALVSALIMVVLVDFAVCCWLVVGGWWC